MDELLATIVFLITTFALVELGVRWGWAMLCGLLMVALTLYCAHRYGLPSFNVTPVP